MGTQDRQVKLCLFARIRFLCNMSLICAAVTVILCKIMSFESHSRIGHQENKHPTESAR